MYIYNLNRICINFGKFLHFCSLFWRDTVILCLKNIENQRFSFETQKKAVVLRNDVGNKYLYFMDSEKNSKKSFSKGYVDLFSKLIYHL